MLIITELSKDILLVEADFSARRKGMMGAIMVVMVGTVIGMVLDQTVWVGTGGALVAALYAGLVFGLEPFAAQFDRANAAVRVSRIRRRQEVSVTVLPLHDLINRSALGTPIGDQIFRAAPTLGSRMMPVPAIAPEDIRRIDVWLKES